MRNHIGRFRPVRGGIAIVNPRVNQFGTLGLIATANGLDAWLVSAFHVLCTPNAPTDGHTIFQPTDEDPSDAIATTADGRADYALDCAAARLHVAHTTDVLGIGPLRELTIPQVGMHVLKSGMGTGVTEGIIDRIEDDDVRIKVIAGFPKTYDLSQASDSGAVWVTVQRNPVALHTGNDTGAEFATAKRLTTVLQRLGLRTP